MNDTPDTAGQASPSGEAAPAPSGGGPADSLVEQLKAAGPSPHAGDEGADEGAATPGQPDAKDESLLGAKGDPAEGAA
jgi:hypothetical protein